MSGDLERKMGRVQLLAIRYRKAREEAVVRCRFIRAGDAGETVERDVPWHELDGEIKLWIYQTGGRVIVNTSK